MYEKRMKIQIFNLNYTNKIMITTQIIEKPIHRRLKGSYQRVQICFDGLLGRFCTFKYQLQSEIKKMEGVEIGASSKSMGVIAPIGPFYDRCHYAELL